MFPTCLRNINQADERKFQNSSAPNRQHQTTVAKTANSPIPFVENFPPGTISCKYFVACF